MKRCSRIRRKPWSHSFARAIPAPHPVSPFRLVYYSMRTAITPALALLTGALMALQRVEFRMPGPKVVRLEEWPA